MIFIGFLKRLLGIVVFPLLMSLIVPLLILSVPVWLITGKGVDEALNWYFEVIEGFLDWVAE